MQARPAQASQRQACLSQATHGRRGFVRRAVARNGKEQRGRRDKATRVMARLGFGTAGVTWSGEAGLDFAEPGMAGETRTRLVRQGRRGIAGEA